MRNKIKKEFEKLGAEIALYETDLTPSVNTNTYREDILQTDFVVFIIDERYGAKTEFGISGTEEEFNIVRFSGKHCHVYLKETEKTDEAKKFEDLLKSKAISYYYYKDDRDLLKKMFSTTFTIAKEIIVSQLLQQKIELNLIKKLAIKHDYEIGLYYCKRFERIFELYKLSNGQLKNSNLLLVTMEVHAIFCLNNTIYVDKKMEDIFRQVFAIANEIIVYIANNSSMGQMFNTIKFVDDEEICVYLNNPCQSYDLNWIENKTQEMYNAYYFARDYVAARKFESDIL